MSDNKNYNQKLDNAWFILRKKKKSEKRFKSLSIVLFLIFTFFVISEVSANQCGVAGSSWESNGNTIQTYTLNNDSPCLDTVIMTAVEYAELKQISEMFEGINEIDALSIAESFTWGFGTWLSFWWLSYVIRNARMVIKKS
jgi:hypothetical protein